MTRFWSDILLPFPNSNDLNSCVASLLPTFSQANYSRTYQSLSFYVSIRTYQISQKCKIDTLFQVLNQFFVNWLFSWEFGKDIFSQNWKETKKFTIQKKKSPFKNQVISFLNLKDIISCYGWKWHFLTKKH